MFIILSFLCENIIKNESDLTDFKQIISTNHKNGQLYSPSWSLLAGFVSGKYALFYRKADIPGTKHGKKSLFAARRVYIYC